MIKLNKFKVNLLIVSVLLMIYQLVAFSRQTENSRLDLLNEAVDLYNDGHYQKALVCFNNLNKKVNSAGLFYNIGNCYFKIKNLGEAVVAYNSALKRDPFNPDIQHNLNHVISLTTDKIGYKKDIANVKGLMINLLKHFELKTYQKLLFIILLLLFCTLLISKIRTQGFFRNKLLLLCLLSLLCVNILAVWVRYVDITKLYGVVLTKELTVRYGPSFNDSKSYILHEGTMFLIHKEVDKWYLIEISDGKVGWVPKHKIKIVE